MLRFSDEDHARISAAVSAAERQSDGEIVTIVTPKSDSYHDVGLQYAVLAMLLVLPLLAVMPQGWVDWGLGLFLGWNADAARGALLTVLFVLMASVFLIVRYALAYMPLRMALTPPSTKNRRVRRRALELFRVAAEHKTKGRTGVLLYVSLAEHRAEIFADHAIHSKVKPDVWGEAMEALVERIKAGEPGEGMALAVEKVGAVLARHLPPTHDNPNEIPDRLIEL